MNARQDLSRAQAVADDGDAVHLVRADTVALEPVRWLWKDFLPAGMLTILGGAPGCGKTTIALGLAATVTRGGQWPDGTRCAQAGGVLIWSAEDAQPVIAARLAAAGADLKQVHFVGGVTGDGGREFDPARDVDLLLMRAQALPSPPRLLILDPIVSAVAGDSHKGAEVRRALQPVVVLARELGCAVLGITHFSKGTAGRDPVERVTGSIAFAALARVVLVAAKARCEADSSDGPTASRHVLMRAKSNIGPDDGGFAYELERVDVAPEVEGQRVRWMEALDGTARELLADAEAQAADDGGDAAGVDGFLRGLLADGPVSAKAIKADADGAGYAWRTVQRAAGRIGVDRRKGGMKGGWVWALGDDGQQRRCHEGAKGAAQKVQASSASSGVSVASSGDCEVF